MNARTQAQNTPVKSQNLMLELNTMFGVRAEQVETGLVETFSATFANSVRALADQATRSRWAKDISQDVRDFTAQGYATDVALAIACKYWLS